MNNSLHSYDNRCYIFTVLLEKITSSGGPLTGDTEIIQFTRSLHTQYKCAYSIEHYELRLGQRELVIGLL